MLPGVAERTLDLQTSEKLDQLQRHWSHHMLFLLGPPALTIDSVDSLEFEVSVIPLILMAPMFGVPFANLG
jgi:hypothetical protein